MIIRFISLFAVMLWLVSTLMFGVEAGTNLASRLFPPRAAQEILDTEVEAASINTEPDVTVAKTLISRCSYTTAVANQPIPYGKVRTSNNATASNRNSAHIDVTLRQSENADVAKGHFEGAKVVYRGQDVSGLGDAAFRSALPAQLHVLKGKVWIMVTAGRFKADPKLEEATAREILRRLREDL